MKYFLLFATLLCLTGTACKKSKKLGPMDVLPGNWELKNTLARSEPPSVTYRFALDGSYTRTAGATVQSGTFNVHYISDDHNIVEVLLTKGQDPIGSFILEMVTVHEFKFIQIEIGPGPSQQYVLLRAK